MLDQFKSAAENVRKSYSSYWMGHDVEDLAEQLEAGSIAYVERLRKVQRAVASFVQIVTGKDIPVVFSSGRQSYTSGAQVVLSADTNPNKIDALVGTALHEGAHCLLSNESLKFLPYMHAHFRSLIAGRAIQTDADRLGIPMGDKADIALGKSGTSVYSHVQMIMNVLEDRRIDMWMYQNAPGYRPYYDSLYDTYWHSEKIDEMLKDKRFHDRSIDAYMLFAINMTNPYYDPYAMPGLDTIRKIANLTEKGLAVRGDDDAGWGRYKQVASKGVNMDFDRLPKLFVDAVKIVEVMYKNALSIEGEAGKSQPGDMDGEGLSDLPNMDNGGGRPLTKEEREQLKDALGKLKKFLEHDTDKKRIDDTTANELDQLNKTNAKVTTVDGDFLPRNVKARVVIYRDVTKDIVTKKEFPFSYSGMIYGHREGVKNPLMENALKNGMRMGAVLAHRIRVMQDEKPLTYNRQKHGRLDKRRVANLGHGLEDVFAFTVIERKKPANLWMDIDFSGSMNGRPSEQAMTVAVAIAKAAELTRTLNTTIAVRDGNNDVRVAILYDSRKHSFKQLQSIVPYLSTAGGTPESLAFEAVKDEMLQMYKDERKYFINLSDGEPAHSFTWKGRGYSYGGQQAYDHTRRLMREFRQAGIGVLSYFISDYGAYEHEGFRQMYGNDAHFIDPSQVTQIARTLNKLLMQED